jgi:hypothetical protein
MFSGHRVQITVYSKLLQKKIWTFGRTPENRGVFPNSFVKKYAFGKVSRKKGFFPLP